MNDKKSEILFLTFLFAAALLVVPAAPAGSVTIGASHVTLNPIPTTSPGIPFITIDPIGDHAVGEVFFVNGTTNLGTWEKSLILDIEWSGFNPGGFGSSFYRTNASIQPGENGIGTWSAAIIPSQWERYNESPSYHPAPVFARVYSGEYVANVESSTPLGPSVAAQQTFGIVPPENNVTPTSTTPAGVQSSSPMGTGSGNTPSPAGQGTPVPVIVPVIAVFMGVVLLAVFNARKRE